MKSLLKKLLGKELIARLWHKPKAMFAALLAGFPANDFTVIAVAGTKGKTSTAYYISHLLDTAGISNALFSTAALKINSEETLNTLKLTTPTPFFLQQFLRKAKTSGCTHLVIEVSSHALVQERLWGVPFHVVALTNLAPDHLEYHASTEEYQNIHLRLITHRLRHLIVNGIDSHSRNFTALPVTTTILKDSDECYTSLLRSIPLIGVFNTVNAYFAYAVVRTLGIDEETLLKGVRSLRSAPGRMESIPNDHDVTVFVDYAHSAESLNNFFSAVKPSAKERLIAVFGACGERDPSQRPLMGELLDRYADIVVVTNDDPYSEEPEKIAGELRSGIRSKKELEALFTILDRRDAIAKALSLASAGDTICVLGKGAEQWQVFKHKKIPWDDRRVVKEELQKIRNA